MKCIYCKKLIDENKKYCQLATGDMHMECWGKAFTSKDLYSRVFKLKNRIKYRFKYLSFAIGFTIYLIRNRKRERKNE